MLKYYLGLNNLDVASMINTSGINITNIDIDIHNLPIKNISKLSGKIHISKLQIEYSNQNITSVFDKISIFIDSPIHDIYNVVNDWLSSQKNEMDDVELDLSSYTSKLNEYINEMNVHVKDICITYENEYTFKIISQCIDLQLCSSHLKSISMKYIKFFFNTGNTFYIDNINIIFDDNGLVFKMMYLNLEIEPIFLIFIKKSITSFIINRNNNIKDSKEIRKEDKSNYSVSLILNKSTFYFLENTISLGRLEVYLPKHKFILKSLSIYNDDNEMFLNIQNIIYEHIFLSIHKIKFILSKKLNSILELWSEWLDIESPNNQDDFNSIVYNFCKQSKEKLMSSDETFFNEFVIIKQLEDEYLEKQMKLKLSILKTEIEIKQESIVAKLDIDRLKCIKYSDNSLYFRIYDLYIRDLTDGKWDYIIYKNSIYNMFELKINSTNNKLNHSKDPSECFDRFDVYINPSNIVINLDDKCVKICLPIIEQLLEIVNNMLSIMPNVPIFIKECLVREHTCTISYKPPKMNIKNIIKGKKEELIKIGTINDSKLHFPEISVYNSFSYGELIEKIAIKYKKPVERQALYIFLENDTLKYFLFPFLRLRDIDPQKLSLKTYFKGVSIDILELIRKSLGLLEKNIVYSSKGKKTKLSPLFKMIINVQCILDNEKKVNFDKKFKD